MEGVIKNVKSQPNRKMNRDTPALYFHSRWKDLKKNSHTLAVELEKAGKNVTRHKEDATLPSTTTNSKELSIDAKANTAFMGEDAV
jgi:hypothetical protein